MWVWAAVPSTVGSRGNPDAMHADSMHSALQASISSAEKWVSPAGPYLVRGDRCGERLTESPAQGKCSKDDALLCDSIQRPLCDPERIQNPRVRNAAKCAHGSPAGTRMLTRRTSGIQWSYPEPRLLS